MSVAPWPDHLLSVADWDALPEDTMRHYEVEGGVLQVSPRPGLGHQWAVKKLLSQLDAQLPVHLRAFPEIEVSLFGEFPATVRAPDIAVVHERSARQVRWRCVAADVALVIEVISTGSSRRDRVTKFDEYGLAGIQHYWLVDLDAPASSNAYTLASGYYELAGDAVTTLSVDTLAPITIDIPSLEL